MATDHPTVYHAIVQNSNGPTVVNELFTTAAAAKDYIETVLTERFDHDLADWDDDHVTEAQDWDEGGSRVWLTENENWYIRTDGDSRTGVVLAVTPHDSLQEGLRAAGDLDLLPPEERVADGVLRLDTTAEEHDVLEEVVQYRVGPAIDFFGIEDRQTVIKGLDPADLRSLMDACASLEQEYATDGFYDMAQAADRVESMLGHFYVPGVTTK